MEVGSYQTSERVASRRHQRPPFVGEGQAARRDNDGPAKLHDSELVADAVIDVGDGHRQRHPQIPVGIGGSCTYRRPDERQFLAPGVLHCAGGPGPDRADWPRVIVDWVEKGTGPQSVIAAKVVDGKTVRTRPLCPFPQRAVYKGSGNTDEAANFVCKGA